MAAVLRVNRYRFRALRARGVPAILCGAATIVFAAGVAAAMQRAVVVLPETLREARLLITVVRGERQELLP